MSQLDLLKNVFVELSDESQLSVLKFAQFLSVEKTTAEPEVLLVKQAIARPEEETVVQALKRLRQVYPMLNLDSLMRLTSEQMTAHMIKGQSKKITIDNLELKFEQKYQQKLSQSHD